MTEIELLTRLRESYVLDGPDAWRSNGYLEDAQRAGWKLVTALKQANEVSQELGYHQAWIRDTRAYIARLASLTNSLTKQDIDSIIQSAAALNLSADFVRNRWVPTELARLRGPAAVLATGAGGTTEATARSSAPTANSVVNPSVALASAVPPAPVVSVVTSQPVAQFVSATAPEPPPTVPTETAPSRTDSASVVRSFTAIPDRIRPGESVALTWTVDELSTVTVDELGAGLPPQHQGWVKPRKTMNYTLFDPDKRPLSTVRVEVLPRDRSVAYGLLGAILLIFGFVWYNNASKPERSLVSRTEQTATRNQTSTETGASKVYDAVAGEPDERGWRRARYQGRWGFIDRNNQWVIQPAYDAVTQFRRDKAIVFQKGRLLTINRDGESVAR